MAKKISFRTSATPAGDISEDTYKKQIQEKYADKEALREQFNEEFRQIKNQLDKFKKDEYNLTTATLYHLASLSYIKILLVNADASKDDVLNTIEVLLEPPYTEQLAKLAKKTK